MSPRRPRRRPRLLAPLLAGWVLLACTTPQVPIPPPNPESLTFALDGTTDPPTATFRSDPRGEYSLARVYVENETQGVGVITTALIDGSVDETPPFPGDEGDRIVVTFRKDRQSASTCVYLREGRSSQAQRCE